MAYRVAQQHNLFINKLKRPSLVNASGAPMLAKVNICANSLMCIIDAVISSDLRDDLLVGCEDLRKLKIIPANFPHQTVRSVATVESMKQRLPDRFPDTLSDSLSPVPMQTASGHMHINMDHSAIPHQEVVARRIPLRYKSQTDSRPRPH